jgi:hypothetical protein
MKKGARAINKSITNITKKHNYRSDLTKVGGNCRAAPGGSKC